MRTGGLPDPSKEKKRNFRTKERTFSGGEPKGWAGFRGGGIKAPESEKFASKRQGMHSSAKRAAKKTS